MKSVPCSSGCNVCVGIGSMKTGAKRPGQGSIGNTTMPKLCFAPPHCERSETIHERPARHCEYTTLRSAGMDCAETRGPRVGSKEAPATPEAREHPPLSPLEPGNTPLYPPSRGGQRGVFPAGKWLERPGIKPIPWKIKLLICSVFLRSAAKQSRAVELDWKAPAANHGGPVRSYIVLRREAVKGASFGKWEQAGMALKTPIILTGQPRFTQLGYRIVAANAGGTSMPSNTAAVVL